MAYSKKSKKASKKSKGSKICPAGKAWAERTLILTLVLMPTWRHLSTVKILIMPKGQRGRKVGELKKWRDQDWVRIGTDGENQR